MRTGGTLVIIAPPFRVPPYAASPPTLVCFVVVAVAVTVAVVDAVVVTVIAAVAAAATAND